MTVIVTDSGSDLSLEEIKELKVEMLPLKVNFGSEGYADKFEITNEEFFKRMRSEKELPTTTLVSVGAFQEVYERYPDEDIVVITLAGELSGTNQSAHIAKDHVGRDNIYIVDSGNVSAALGLIVMEAVKMRDAGASAKEIAERAEELSERVRAVAVLESLENLIKGGRLSPVAGMVGTMLSVKPILMIKHSVLDPSAKARGFSNALAKAAEMVNKEIDPSMPISYLHANNEEGALSFSKLIGIDGRAACVGSGIGTHAGEGVVGIAYFVKA